VVTTLAPDAAHDKPDAGRRLPHDRLPDLRRRRSGEPRHVERRAAGDEGRRRHPPRTRSSPAFDLVSVFIALFMLGVVIPAAPAALADDPLSRELRQRLHAYTEKAIREAGARIACQVVAPLTASIVRTSSPVATRTHVAPKGGARR